MRQEVLRMERVTCQEYGIIQLDDFNLRISSGEIMGLLPANNHGLTALLQLLQHNTPLKYGYVYYRGEQVNTWRTVKHRRNRIGLIQSESCLVAGLTVADNIFVLRPGFRTWFIRPSLLRKQLFPFLDSIDIHISADAYIEQLNSFEKAVVDVLKSVVAGCQLIVLRDISSKLSESELKKIYRLIRHYAAQGFSFLHIDFHFEELHHICDKVALMSNGRIIKVLSSNPANSEVVRQYTNVYAGKVKEQIARVSTAQTACAPVFAAEKLSGNIIRSLSFSVSAGECVVLQDVDNLIYDELLSLLTGETFPQSGQMLLEGQRFVHMGSREIAVIQELPSKSMLFHEMSYLDNLCFSLDHRLPEIWRNHKICDGIRQEYAPLLGDEVFDLRVDMLNETQKYDLVYTRIAIQKPKVVFCAQPFRRADVELRMHIWELLKMLLGKGIAVVMLAVNLADSLSLADRLIRIQKSGRVKIYHRSQFAAMPINAPWIDLYHEVQSGKCAEE